MDRFKKLAALFLFGLSVCLGDTAMAQESRKGFSIIRDVEIEKTIHDFGDPIFTSAGLTPSSVRIVIIRDPTLNAFVAGGMNIFFHTGVIQATQTPEQLIGIMAHETGHISGGHLVRGAGAMKNASAEAILSMVLGTAAAVFSGSPSAGAAILTGGQHVAQRGILSFTRSQESSADAAAMRFLDDAKISTKGLLEFLQKLSGQELLPVDRQVEFVRTHPLTQDRIDAVKNHVENSPLANTRVSQDMIEKHERMKAKLLGYLQPESALLRYGEKDPRRSARYARAIAHYRKGDVPQALSVIDGLLKEEPNNPFFYELKGQVLFENGRIAESLAPYKRSVELLPSAGLLQAAYGHALLETQDPAKLEEAITRLNQSLETESREPATWRFLATAWGRKNNEGMVAYCLAEEAQTRGDMKGAKVLAEKAIKLLPKSSPYALKAQDIKQAKIEDDDD
jgi:predicted Zn-dependent protease